MRLRVEHTCCRKQAIKRGFWSPEEDMKLIGYISVHGHGCWSSLPDRAGLQRCGKSCRLRWMNYLRPGIKRGNFSKEEEGTIIFLHKIMDNRWAQIAKCLPGRTDSEIKNYWNTCLKKRLASNHDNRSSSEISDPHTFNDLQGISSEKMINNNPHIDMDLSDANVLQCRDSFEYYNSLLQEKEVPFQAIKQNFTNTATETSRTDSSQFPSQSLMPNSRGQNTETSLQDDIVMMKSYSYNEQNEYNVPYLVSYDISVSSFNMFSPDLPGPDLLQ